MRVRMLVGLLAALTLISFSARSVKCGGLSAPVAKDDEPRYRSPIHICLSPDGRFAYVVNETADSVAVLDVLARTVIEEISVGPHPAHAVCSPNGRTLYVSCQDTGAVSVVDLETKRVTRQIETGDEPYGLSVSPDGRTLHVVNAISQTVSMIDVESGKTLVSTPVGEHPRFATTTPDGTRLLVGNGLSRDVSIIDAASGRLLETRSLGKGSMLRQLTCSPDGRWAFVAHLISRDKQMALQIERGWIHSNGLSILDLKQRGHYVTLLLDEILAGAANPWGLAISADGQRLYVSLAGVHQVALVDVPKALQLVRETGADEVDLLAQDVAIVQDRKISRRVPAGGIGPRGLALSEVTNELLVANYFSDTVSILDADTGALLTVVPLGPPQEMTLRRTGEMLFNDARLCYQGWFSCASCHQEDAGVDGLNWDLPNDGLGNPKNVKSLHDVYDTAPAMWTGARKSMEAAVAAGQRFLGFLPKPENQRALVAFIADSRRAPNPYRGRQVAAVRRGKQMFSRARCVGCHPPSKFTDGRKHDLGLVNETDLRARFDTPSLRECYRTAPYFHDGRARTLREIFSLHNPDDLHGRTSDLSPSDLEDLIKYLRTL